MQINISQKVEIIETTVPAQVPARSTPAQQVQSGYGAQREPSAYTPPRAPDAPCCHYAPARTVHIHVPKARPSIEQQQYRRQQLEQQDRRQQLEQQQDRRQLEQRWRQQEQQRRSAIVQWVPHSHEDGSGRRWTTVSYQCHHCYLKLGRPTKYLIHMRSCLNDPKIKQCLWCPFASKVSIGSHHRFCEVMGTRYIPIGEQLVLRNKWKALMNRSNTGSQNGRSRPMAQYPAPYSQNLNLI